MKKLQISNLKFQIKNKGFTLIELLLYIGIVSIFIVVSTIFILNFLDTKAKNTTIVEVEAQGAMAMRLMSQTIRNATAINSPSQGNSSSTLSVNVTDPVKSPTVFDLSDGAIRIKEGAAAPINLTNSYVTASALTFTNVSRNKSPGTIKIQFSIDFINTEGKNIFDYAKTFYESATLLKK